MTTGTAGAVQPNETDLTQAREDMQKWEGRAFLCGLLLIPVAAELALKGAGSALPPLVFFGPILMLIRPRSQ